MKTHVTVDIETFATPETSGYDIVIPNYAVVGVPEKPTDDIVHFAYIKLPFQPQLEAGLKVDAGSMNFWMNVCQQSYKSAYNEIVSTLTLDEVEIISGNDLGVERSDTTVLDMWKTLRYDVNGDDRDLEIWGNGCHFDCSILQANHLKLFGTGNLWKYSSPQNARSLKNRLSDAQDAEMGYMVAEKLEQFVERLKTHNIFGLELHHPLYDAAREAIQISYCLSQIDQRA